MVSQHLLISLEERHAFNILAETKLVELRRRRMHVNSNDVVWMYVKQPIAAIVGYAIVDFAETAKPKEIWDVYGAVSGLSKDEFIKYFSDTSSGMVLGLKTPRTLMRPIPLTTLRKTSLRFHPPQFYCRTLTNPSLHRLLQENIGLNC
jgi:predicted transcriptional regulator